MVVLSSSSFVRPRFLTWRFVYAMACSSSFLSFSALGRLRFVTWAFREYLHVYLCIFFLVGISVLYVSPGVVRFNMKYISNIRILSPLV